MNIESGPPWAFILREWRFAAKWWPVALIGVWLLVGLALVVFV